MPGILPMKVIRVGSSAQSRIAQACDRCRSKKIRCDGIRPCCTQCANVGFECKTSDKLSRRAFPRGYTESLEDRVRGLEAEVRELKDLLDEKDEKIDMLSRIHNFSPSSRKCSASLSPVSPAQVKVELEPAREQMIQIDSTTSAEMGGASTASPSTASFITSFSQKSHDAGKCSVDVDPERLKLHSRPSSSCSSKNASKIPPRLLSDQYINLFFQEWHPLFPILHRPALLKFYEDYIAEPDASRWHNERPSVAQLFLVFEIAAISSISRIKQSTTSYEPQWRRALNASSSTVSIPIIQCHVLAQLYYLLKGDYSPLARHRGTAVAMCHQLGLHQNANIGSSRTIEGETSKRTFWCQYMLDKFTSAATGTPMLLHDEDVSTQFPEDMEEDAVDLQEVAPNDPSDVTKISSALALVKVSQVLSKTLAQLYPAKSSYQLSLNKLRALSEELDLWSQNLPVHLRLRFVQDKPSTNVVSCRSPLLSLAYFFTRSLIHRPLVCHGTGSNASASTVVLAEAAKHTLQILDLLNERRMNYTFPFNKSELLLSSGFSLLWQSLELEDDSKLVKDNEKSVDLLITMLDKDSPTACIEFQRVASSFVTISRIASPAVPNMDVDNSSRHSFSTMPSSAVPKHHKSTRQQIQALTSRFSNFSSTKYKVDETQRRATVPRIDASPNPDPGLRSHHSISLASTRSTPVLPLYVPVTRQHQPRLKELEPQQNVNLDYFPLGEDVAPAKPTRSSSSTTLPMKMAPPPQLPLTDAAWEQLLTNIDLSQTGTPTNGPASQEWSPEDDLSWPIDLTVQPKKAAVPKSLLSYSGESAASADDLTTVFSAPSSNNGSTGTTSTALESLGAADAEELKRFDSILIPFDEEYDVHA